MDKWKECLRAIRENNNNVAWSMSEFIDETPKAITPALLQEADPNGNISEEIIYAALMAGLSGIEDDAITSEYFIPAVTALEPDDYACDLYLAKIKFPDVASKHWKFTHYHYSPYEAFICDDIIRELDSREIPRIGYFRKRFRYPAVEQNHREWMAVKPSEIATMKPALDIISGKVVTFGLGLGYFTFMASENPSVFSVDVVERDEEVIDLFSKYILEQFPHKEKVRIIKSDAFDYMTDMPEYDYAFVDLWHDTSDGLELYIKARKCAKVHYESGKHTVFLYWVEKSLLSAYRWIVFDKIIETSTSESQALERLGDDYLKTMIDGEE